MTRRWLVWCSLLGCLTLWLGTSVAQPQPKAGGTLRIALSGDLTFPAPTRVRLPGYETFWVWNNIFNSLLTMTPARLKVVRTGHLMGCPGRRQDACISPQARRQVP